MFINNFDPVAFNFLFLEIRWYSLSYIFGILIGWIYCKKFLIKDEELKLKFDDFISYLILAIIVGGRLGYVFFYNPNYYIQNFSEIFMIWKGGMSFHGAILGILVANFYYTKKHNINFFSYLDYISMVAPIGLFLGRISNFINSELYGRKTDFFLSTIFPKVDEFERHPSQLYEAVFEGVVLFIILNFIFKKYVYIKGRISSLFLIFYSTFRFFIEFTREPDAQIGYLFFNMSMGQILCLIFFSIGLTIFYSRDEK